MDERPVSDFIRGCLNPETFISYHIEYRVLISRTRHKLIIKLITEAVANSREKSIKPN